MNASKQKEQCLTFSDHLDPEGLIIAKRGKSIVRLVPADNTCPDLIGSMKDKIQIHGDILTTGVDSILIRTPPHPAISIGPLGQVEVR